MPATRTIITAATLTLAATLATTNATAEWPQTPEESIQLGIAQGTFLGQAPSPRRQRRRDLDHMAAIPLRRV